MKVVNLILIVLLYLPLTSFSQGIQLASSAGKATETTSTASAEWRILPLFGEQSKTPEQIDEEIKFLSDCDKMFDNRVEAGKFFATRGWEYLQEGQLDTASYRFNLANLLDKNNADPYWGLGVICFQQDKLDDASNMLKRGSLLAPENVSLLVDLSTVEVRIYEVKSDQVELINAEEKLQKALKLDPTYSQAYYNLSVVEYYKENFDKSWQYLHEGRKLDFSQLNLSFVEMLKEKLPDPQGFFK